MPVTNRRSFLTLFAGASLAMRLRAFGADGPTIRSVKLGKPVAVAESHGDTWAPACAGDGNLYSPSNDTFGFRHITDSNIAFSRLEGADPISLKGTTINPMADYGRSALEGADGCTWKSSGCAFIDGAFYWVVARHKYGEKSGDPYLRQTAANASMIRSEDFGRTWTRTAHENIETPMFPGSRFATPYFVQYPSRAEADGANHYVYAVSNNGFWDNGDSIILGRVPRSKIAALRGEDWAYFRSGDGLATSAWTRNMDEAEPVLARPGRLGMTGAVYVADRRRYLMISWHYPAGGGKATKDACTHTVWDFYEAPKPWGPWNQIGSRHFAPQGYYSPQICPKFLSKERAYIWTAGDWNDPKYYRLTIIPIEFQ